VLRRFEPRLKLKAACELVLVKADTPSVKLESANKMVARVSDTIFDWLRCCS
jgi:hypothetical protein